VSSSLSETSGIPTPALKLEPVSGQESEANFREKSDIFDPMLSIRIYKGSIRFWLLGLHLDKCPQETLVMIYGQSHPWIHTTHSILIVHTTIQ